MVMRQTWKSFHRRSAASKDGLPPFIPVNAQAVATAGHGSASSAVAGPARAASAAQAAKAERPLPAAVLPEPLRSRVAALVFGGAVQSQERRQSFVLMAGRIVREGEALAPGIVLERIGARSLLLRVDGQAVDLPL